MEQLEQETRRVTDRLRSLSLVALTAPVSGPVPSSDEGWRPSRAAMSRAAAQRIADLVAGVEPCPLRTLPHVGDGVVADQIAVCAADLGQLLRGDLPGAAVAGAEALDVLVQLRRAL